MVVMLETNCVLLSAWLFVFVAGGQFVITYKIRLLSLVGALVGGQTSNRRIRSLHLPSETTF